MLPSIVESFALVVDSMGTGHTDSSNDWVVATISGDPSSSVLLHHERSKSSDRFRTVRL